MGEVINLHQIQSLNYFSKGFFIAVSNQFLKNVMRLLAEADGKGSGDQTAKYKGLGVKFLVGKQFGELKDKYAIAARECLRNIIIYEVIRLPDILPLQLKTVVQLCQYVISEPIEKTFRKIQPFQNASKFSTLVPHLVSLDPNAPADIPFADKEKLLFKYPLLRPVWENKSKHNFYYILQRFKKTPQVELISYRGQQWVGFEGDREAYLDKLVRIFLKNIPEHLILITDDNQEESFFASAEVLPI